LELTQTQDNYRNPCESFHRRPGGHREIGLHFSRESIEIAFQHFEFFLVLKRTQPVVSGRSTFFDAISSLAASEATEPLAVSFLWNTVLVRAHAWGIGASANAVHAKNS
jgi:hypothetical protein